MTLSPIQPNYVSKQEFGEFKDEMYEFRDEMYQFKKEVKNEFKEFRREMNGSFISLRDGINTHLATSLVQFKDEIKESLLNFKFEINNDVSRHIGQVYEKSQHDLGLALELLKDMRNTGSGEK